MLVRREQKSQRPVEKVEAVVEMLVVREQPRSNEKAPRDAQSNSRLHSRNKPAVGAYLDEYLPKEHKALASK
ncbi:uncharacterized protein DFL_001424 [Arthrobotrys flagrans]|uniref:Uncharacterized protein n=1 Tax=Arthrobotrys flagrans TaxID=97331 RepID=A0A437A7P7_ARTFL|nr:hypothetical protein DFL_001424 [Arthrobotrys flagrans]